MRIRDIWAARKVIFRKISHFQARIILTIFYFIFVTPIAIISKRSSDPFELRKITGFWVMRPQKPANIEEIQRQY